ncbi:phospholipid scramblase 1-like [Branchiostoma lanceolatum]|uniref:phospholipid scramblase 1-like n=1 Tax=Branchiostoma lanceolatum TaxID=7740 RepID=UPI0034518391
MASPDVDKPEVQLELEPITAQPSHVVLTDQAPVPIGCPPGLEYLTQIDQLLVKQKVELLEVLSDIETKNKYVIKNSMGQKVYYAYEDSSFCTRMCCGNRRGFRIIVVDNNEKEVIRVKRKYKCCGGIACCANLGCAAHEIKVQAPPGTTIGYARQQCTCWKPHFSVRNADHDTVFDVKGPCCIWSGACYRCDTDFKVYSPDGHTVVGKVSRQHAGFIKEAFSDATNMSVTFPMDLDVKMKATMLGLAFLIDFMYFEDQHQDSD